MRITICGGGNGAHCLAGLVSLKRDVVVCVLTMHEGEADKWKESLKNDNLQIISKGNDENTTTIQCKPVFITRDVKTAITDADVIFMTVPAFAHSYYLREIIPFIKISALIVGLPGHPGFVFQCNAILGEKAEKCAVMTTESLPWACRIVTYGKSVQILAYKQQLSVAVTCGKHCTLNYSPLEQLQWILGDKPKLNQVPSHITLDFLSKSYIHPTIMFGKWSTWDGQFLTEKPLFYQGVDKTQAELLTKVSEECTNIARTLIKHGIGHDTTQFGTFLEWLLDHYSEQIGDKTNLESSLQSNAAYNGLTHPMTELKGGYAPDFTYRYISEDVPFGLLYMKGMAKIVGVQTPTMDKIILWAQGVMGQEYLVESQLQGKDISKTRAPQVFGINTVEDISTLDTF